jgi:hypothetical protein
MYPIPIPIPILVALFVRRIQSEYRAKPIVATSIVIAVCGTNSSSKRNPPPVEFAMNLFPLAVLAIDAFKFTLGASVVLVPRGLVFIQRYRTVGTQPTGYTNRGACPTARFLHFK